MPLIATLLLLPLLSLPVQNPQAQRPETLRNAPYPIFETDKISNSEYRERREKVMAKMAPGSIAVFFTNPTRNRRRL